MKRNNLVNLETNSSTGVPLITVVHMSTAASFRGGERQVSYLHEGLPEHGIHSVLVCRKNGALGNLGLRNTYPLYRFSFAPLGVLSVLPTIRNLHPDILHCHDSRSFSVGYLAGRILGIPVVASRRVVFPIRKTKFNRLRYGNCSGLIAISGAVAERCKQIAPSQRIEIIPSGVRWDEDEYDHNEARSRLGISRDAFVIGSVAHFTREKNLNLIIQTARKLGPEFPSAKIVCVGPANTNRIDSIPENCTFVGLLENAQKYYKAFDAYVSTSTQEGLGSALVDAVVRDIPIIAVDAGGTRDIPIRPGSLVNSDRPHDFYEGVGDLLADYGSHSEAARRNGKLARDRFSIPSMVSRHVPFYRSVVSDMPVGRIKNKN